MLSNDIRNYRAMDSLYIAHHGILGQKWGKKSGPPYPLGSGDHTPAEKSAAKKAGVSVGKDSGKGSIENVKESEPKKNIIEKAVDAYKDNKKKKQQEENLKKAREAAAKKREENKTAEEKEADRQKALNSGDYAQIQKYAKESSTKELQDALSRADTLKRLDKAVIDNTPVEPSIQDKINDAASKIKTATNLASSGIEAWNKVASVWNTFADEESMLPEIGKNFKEEQEKKAKERAEKERSDKIDAIMRRNNPEEILKNSKYFTNDELKQAAARLKNESTVKSYGAGGNKRNEWQAEDNANTNNSGGSGNKKDNTKNTNGEDNIPKSPTDTKKTEYKQKSTLDEFRETEGYKKMQRMTEAMNKMRDDAVASGKYEIVDDDILGSRVVKKSNTPNSTSVAEDLTNYLNKASSKPISTANDGLSKDVMRYLYEEYGNAWQMKN